MPQSHAITIGKEFYISGFNFNSFMLTQDFLITVVFLKNTNHIKIPIYATCKNQSVTWGRRDMLGLMDGEQGGVYVEYVSLIVSCYLLP